MHRNDKMYGNYTLSKIMHKTNHVKPTPEGEKAMLKFQRLAYAIMVVNVLVAASAIAIILFLVGVIK